MYHQAPLKFTAQLLLQVSLSWSLVVKGKPRCPERESPAVPETEKGKKVKAKRLQFLGGGRILRLRWKLAQPQYDKPRETYYFLIIKVRYENKVVVWASGGGGGGDWSGLYDSLLFNLENVIKHLFKTSRKILLRDPNWKFMPTLLERS